MTTETAEASPATNGHGAKEEEKENGEISNDSHHQRSSEELLEFIKTCALQVLEAEKALIHLVSSEDPESMKELMDLQYKIETTTTIRKNGVNGAKGEAAESSRSSIFFPRLSTGTKSQEQTTTMILSPEKAMSLAIRSLEGSLDYFENERTIANSKIGNLECQLQAKEIEYTKQCQEFQRENDLLQLRNQDLNHICDSQTKQLNRMHSCIQDYDDPYNEHESQQLQLQLEIEQRQKEELVLRVQKLEDQITQLNHVQEEMRLTNQQQLAQISKLEQANRYKRFDDQQQEIAKGFVMEDTQDKIGQLEAQNKLLQQQQDEWDSKMNVMRQEWNFTEKRMQRATADRDMLDQKCREQGVELEEVSQELHELQQDFMEMQDEHESLLEEFTTVKDTQQRTMETLTKVTSRLEQLEDERERMDVKVKSQEHLITTLTTDKEKLENYPEKEALEQCLNHMKEKTEALEDDVEQINAQSSILKERIKELETEKQAHDVELKHLTQQVHELEEERNHLLSVCHENLGGDTPPGVADKNNLSNKSLDFISM